MQPGRKGQCGIKKDYYRHYIIVFSTLMIGVRVPLVHRYTLEPPRLKDSFHPPGNVVRSRSVVSYLPQVIQCRGSEMRNNMLEGGVGVDE